MKVVLLAFIVSVAAGHEHGDHEHGDHEHKNHHHHLRGTHRPITMPGHSDHFCGDSPFPKDFKPAISHQDYYGPTHRKLSQRVSQEYKHTGDSVCCPATDSTCSQGHFMDAEDAKEAGLTGPLRVTFVYDLVNATGDDLANVGMCHKLGTFEPTYCGGRTNGKCTTIKCDSDEKLVTPNKVKILVNRTEWVKEYLYKTFEVRKVHDDIVIQKQVLGSYYDTNGDIPPFLNRRYPDTDLVILMSMNPPIKAGVAGWAQCLQTDQWGRCTVGLFNYVATTITGNLAIALAAPNVISSERSTSLHETMHVLGLKSQTRNTGFFRKKDGCPMTDAELFEDAPQSEGTLQDGYVTKRVRHWKTPKVLEIARKQFGCDSLKGVPMEDVNMGYLAHWEARIMGPDVMSYGIGSGEAYISDITLAYFADSGHYLVNYTCGADEPGTCGGGRMLKATGKDEALTERSLSSSLFSDLLGRSEHKKQEGDMLNITDTKTPGYIRWGRHQGCDFVNKKPTPRNWGKKYTCETPQEYGCTPDNRMSSACYLRTYGTETTRAAQYFPCPPGGVSGGRCQSRADPGLPEDYRYFTGKDTQLGGYGEAMDYAPVRLGYWNCMDKKPELTGTIKAVEGQDVDYGEAFAALEQNIPAFGGQVHSSKSRCFASSLILPSEFANINPEWPAYGLCYVANCYKKDYLQFGLQDIFGGVKWYSCKGDEEQKVTVPPYLGFIHCPNATQFCEMETITGKFYNENNQTVELIFWIVVAVIILTLLIVFCCVKPARQNCAKCIKSAVGFERDSKHADQEKTKCQKCLPKVLIALCVLWDIVGLGLVVLAVAIMAAPQMFKDSWDSASRQMYHILFFGIMTAVLASFGFAGARSTGPTLKICFYFYIVIVIFFALILITVSAVWITSLLTVLFDALWDSMRSQFPTFMVGMTSQEAIDYIFTFLKENMVYAIPIVAFIYVSVIAGIIISGYVLRCRNIMGTMGFFANILLLGISVIFFIVGGVIANVLATTPQLWIYSIPTLIPAVCMLAVGVMGVLYLCKCVKTKGKICMMYIHLGLAGVATLVMVGLGGYALAQATQVAAHINELSDSDFRALLDSITQTIGGSWSVETARSLMVQVARVYGVICLVLSAVLILTIITGAQVLHKTKRDFKESETERAGRRMALSTRYKNEADQEWMQEDVEVFPNDIKLNQPPIPQNNCRGGEVEMGPIPVAKAVDVVDAGMAQPIPGSCGPAAKFSGGMRI